MECYTSLRNVTDLLSDGKTPYERRFGKPFKGPIIPFGSLVEYHPITAKDQSRIHQFWKKVLLGLFLGYALYAGEFGRVTYWLQTLRSWRRWTHRKSTQKDSMQRGDISQRKRRIYILQSQKDESNPLEEIRTWEHPRWYGLDQFKERVILTFLENQKGLFHLTTRFRLSVKQLMTSGPCLESSYTAITLNPESNFTRREQNHSPIHWNTLTSPELHKRIWMLNKNAAVYSIGRKTSRRIYVVPGETNEKTADIQARSFMARTLGENGKECQAEGEAKVVTWKSSILTTYENYEGSTSSTRRTRNSRRPSRMLVRNWKHQWLPLCPCKIFQN